MVTRLYFSASLLALGLALAGAAPTAAAALAEVKVVTTLPFLAAIAREVGGDRVTATAIARGDEDPHFLRARPSFMVQLRDADLFVMVGLDLEAGWAPLLLDGARNRRILPGAPGHVDASEGIAVLGVPANPSRSQGDVHPDGNPHYWLDPANGAVIAGNVAAGLTRVDPAGADAYAANLADFRNRLAARTEAWRERMRPLAGKRLVSYHRLWPYLARRFDLQFVAEIEPKPGIPPGARHLAVLADLIRDQEVGLVVHAPFYPPRQARELGRRSGVRAAVLWSDLDEAGGARTYFDLFDRLVDTLVSEFGRPPEPGS